MTPGMLEGGHATPCSTGERASSSCSIPFTQHAHCNKLVPPLPRLPSQPNRAEVGRRTWTTARETVLAAPEALVTKPLQVGRGAR